MSLPTTPLQPCIRQATEHQRLAWLGGSELAILLDAAITGGQLTVIDCTRAAATPRRSTSTITTTRCSCCWKER